MDEAAADGAYIVWLVKSESIIDDYASGHKHFLNLARNNKEVGLLTAPPPPVLPPMPAAVPSGIQPRFAQKAKMAKANANYTEAIGRALGIVAPTAAGIAPGASNTDTPDLKVG